MAGSINFKFPLKSYRRGFFEGNTTTIAAIRENIKVLLLTKKGERLVNSSVGTNIPILLGEMFEQIDVVEMKTRITSEIESAIKTWMPNIKLVSLEVYSEDDVPSGVTINKNQILVRMNYVLSSAEGISDSVQLRL
tara:strand:- start:4798 stop:5205 length:408 start_codon:yes stop_codon:yes gene_type:complete